MLEALQVMRFVHAATPQTQVYLRMFQLESQVLPRRSETTPPVRRGTMAHLNLKPDFDVEGGWGRGVDESRLSSDPILGWMTCLFH